MKAVYHERCGVPKFARFSLVVCALVMAGARAAGPDASDLVQPPAQPSAGTPPQAVAQGPASAPAGPSAMTAATPPDSSSRGEPNAGSQPSATATLPVAAPAPSVANKPGRKVLVDDTVTDAQLKQILRKGYEPQRQAHGNEVYYCRGERELGSRFETKVCRTAARILQEEQQGKEATTNVERTDGNRPVK
jgi:hypothetical protein